MAFVAGWDMTLVMIGTLPLVALTGAVLSRITAVMSARTNAAQAKASSIAQQTVAQVGPARAPVGPGPAARP